MKRLFLAALLVALASPAWAGNLVVNGGFEQCVGTSCESEFRTLFGNAGPTLADLTGTEWGVYAAIPGWTTTAGGGIEIQRGTTVSAQEGFSYVELDSEPKSGGSNSTMTQTLFLVAGDYTLSFWYQPRTGTANDNGINVLFGGLQVGGPAPTVNSTNPPQNDWLKYTFSLNAPSAGNYALTFSAQGLENTLGGFVDDVQLHAVPDGGATLTLLGAALLGLGALRRKLN